MRFNIVLATTGESLTRARLSAEGTWSMEALLRGTRINCFAGHPHHSNVVYAGTQGNGVLRSEDWGNSGSRPGWLDRW